ncbi:MAG: hypothetical protein Q9166_006284 [cf. Caloplaca sp. 2 TL-2023]
MLPKSQSSTAFINGDKQYHVEENEKTLGNTEDSQGQQDIEGNYDFGNSITHHSGRKSYFTSKGWLTVHSNSMHPVGSPLARSWPPTNPPPGSIQDPNQRHLPSSLLKSVSDGSLEISRVTRLIDSTVEPVPPVFADFSKTLKTFELKLAPYWGTQRGRPRLELGLLKSFRQAARSLESLTLKMPSKWEVYGDIEPSSDGLLYDLTRYSLRLSNGACPTWTNLIYEV